MPLPQPLPFVRRALLAAVVTVGGPVSAQTISVTPEPPAASDGAAPSQWERLSLREAVQTGVAQNLDLMTERLRLDRQRRLERGVWAGYSPTVVLDADLVRLRSALDPQGRRTVHTHSAGIVCDLALLARKRNPAARITIDGRDAADLCRIPARSAHY